MGNTLSANEALDTGKDVGRAQAVTEIKRKRPGTRQLPVGSSKPVAEDLPFIRVRELL